MLRFTPSGVVRSPTCVQVRIGNTFDGRLRAGAPLPSRALTDAEVMDNVHHFTEGMRGPRTVACDALVLSGVDEGRLAGLAAVLERARAWGVGHVTLHVAPGAQAAAVAPDAVVMPLREPAHVAALAAWRVHRVGVVPLDVRTLARLDGLTDALLATPPDRLVLTWPYPPSDPPAPVHEVVAALDRWSSRAGQQAWTLKGLPACLAGAHGWRTRTSRNRWYVDADHQQEQALMFFPDVVRLAKDEACRFCARDAACDGVAVRWRDVGLVGPLRPVGVEGDTPAR